MTFHRLKTGNHHKETSALFALQNVWADRSRELSAAIGVLPLLGCARIPERKKLRPQANGCRCKGGRWQIPGHPSNDDSLKQKSATPVERQNAQSPQTHLWCVASAARECECD